MLRQAGLLSQGRDAQRRPCQLETKPLEDVAVWAERLRTNYEEAYRRLDALLARLQHKQPHHQGRTMKEEPTMNTSSTTNGSTREATITLPSDLEIVISREFDAPRQLVFDCHTKADLYRQWYGLEAAADTTVCEIDFRVGGQWRSSQTFVDHDGAGNDFAVTFSGEFREIDAPNGYVYTESFEGFPGPPAVVTMQFDEVDGRTRVTSTCLYETTEIRDTVMQSGMEHGVKEMYSRLDTLLAAQADLTAASQNSVREQDGSAVPGTTRQAMGPSATAASCRGSRRGCGRGWRRWRRSRAFASRAA